MELSLRVSVTVPTEAIVKFDIPPDCTQREFLNNLWNCKHFREDYGALCSTSDPDMYEIRLQCHKFIRIVEDDERPIIVKKELEAKQKVSTKFVLYKRGTRGSFEVGAKGYFYKEGAKRKTFKRRYFILDEVSLHYYKGEKEACPDKRLGIVDYHSCRIFFLKKIDRKKPPTNYAIRMESPDREFLYFFDDEEQMHYWSDALVFAKWAYKNQVEYEDKVKAKLETEAKEKIIAIPLEILKDKFKESIKKLSDVDGGCSSAFYVYNTMRHWNFEKDVIYTLSIFAEIQAAIKNASVDTEKQMFWVSFCSILLVLVEKDYGEGIEIVPEDSSHIIFGMRQHKYTPGMNIVQYIYDKIRYMLCLSFENSVLNFSDVVTKIFFAAFFEPSSLSSITTIISHLNSFYLCMKPKDLIYGVKEAFWVQIFHLIDGCVHDNMKEKINSQCRISKGHLIKRNIDVIAGFFKKYEGDILKESFEVEELLPYSCAIRDLLLETKTGIVKKIENGMFKPLPDDEVYRFLFNFKDEKIAEIKWENLDDVLVVAEDHKASKFKPRFDFIDVFVHLSEDIIHHFRTRIGDTPTDEIMELIGDGFDFLIAQEV